MSMRNGEPQDATQEAWTNINPFTEAANAPGGMESIGGICSAQTEKSRRQ